MKSCVATQQFDRMHACIQCTTGCLLTCDDIPKNGSCSCKAGCCQLDLQKGVQYYQGFFNPLNATTKIWSNHSCNYITVMESSAFNFSTTYLTSTVFYDDTEQSRTPVVMKWTIARNITCEEAKINKMSYACVSDNSYCSMNDAGYVCKCLDGYEGNPYIVGGCTGSSSSSLFSFVFFFLIMQRQYTCFNQVMSGSSKS